MDESPQIAAVSAGETPGVRLAELTWQEAEARLRACTLVVIPIGAATKEHGPHLPLNTDWLQAEYLVNRIIERVDVVVAPCVSYHHYPAFSEYPGSVSLREQTARDLMIDICRSLARFGPSRFYALNTGISTIGPLEQSANVLVSDGITLRWTDLRKVETELTAKLSQQARGTHADEMETSRMLYLAPQVVRMEKAVRDDQPEKGPGGLTRDPAGAGVYSRTGAWGDPTLATRQKGQQLTEALVEFIVRQVDEMKLP